SPKTFRIAWPSGVIRLVRFLFGTGVVVPGKRMVVVVRSEKSPPISPSVGSVRRVGLVKRRILFHSCQAKKNSFRLLIGPNAMGPPRFQPKSAKRKIVLTGA